MRRPMIVAALLVANCNRAPAETAINNEPPSFTAARSAVLSILKDPDSARFSDLRTSATGGVCGQVNAKNGFGGYTGPRAFAWSAARGAMVYSQPYRWLDRGTEAEAFQQLGCSIGPDERTALETLHGYRKAGGSWR